LNISAKEETPLARIPSPSVRLWAGLCVILSIFIVFAVYTTHEVRWLGDFQTNVVQKNRKASLQLLRLQNDAYALTLAERDLAAQESRYPVGEWRPEFTRIREDMNDALRLEGQFAVSTPASDDKRVQLRAALADFGRTADGIFALAQRGNDAKARALIDSELEPRRAMISEIAARLLVLNDRAQADAAAKIAAVYGNVKTDTLVVTAALFLLALGTGLYTFGANRKTFERLRHLAELLESQSGQLRRLSWKLIEVQEETLRRVARDLHDEFGQILTAIGVMLRRAGQKGAGTDPAFNEDLQAVKNVVEETLQKVRDQSQIFRPAILDDFGLVQTLDWFAKQFSRQARIAVRFESNLDGELFAPEDAIHLYRIVQEALNNVARHARASEARVVLNVDDDEVNLEVTDNGAGFEVASLERSAGDGMGLMGMRERAEHLHGALTVLSSPQRGTVVRVRLPLRRTLSPEGAPRAG
jgi:signal transduction histidine kinase